MSKYSEEIFCNKRPHMSRYSEDIFCNTDYILLQFLIIWKADVDVNDDSYYRQPNFLHYMFFFKQCSICDQIKPRFQIFTVVLYLHTVYYKDYITYLWLLQSDTDHLYIPSVPWDLHWVTAHRVWHQLEEFFLSPFARPRV